MALRVLQPEIAEKIAREIEHQTARELEREVEQSLRDLAKEQKEEHDRLLAQRQREIMEAEKAQQEMVSPSPLVASFTSSCSTNVGEDTGSGVSRTSSSFVSGFSSAAAAAAGFLSRSTATAAPDPRSRGPQLLAKGGPRQLIGKTAKKLALDETVFRELIATLRERQVDRIIPVSIVGAAREGTRGAMEVVVVAVRGWRASSVLFFPLATLS